MKMVNIKKGSKVKVTNESFKNGYESDQEKVKKYLEIGKEYTVSKVNEMSWATDVYLEEVPSVRFNSVNFV